MNYHKLLCIFYLRLYKALIKVAERAKDLAKYHHFKAWGA